jgi:hypothetical protein
MTTITETIAADQQDVAEAQAKLDAANAKLAADQQAADAAAPHVSIWQELEATMAKYGAEAQAEVTAAFARIKGVLNL